MLPRNPGAVPDVRSAARRRGGKKQVVLKISGAGVKASVTLRR
jgi:hypothetical protein